MADFTLTKDAEGIATITWDVAGKTMNVMSFEGLQELNDCVDDALADEAVKGIVITSGKDSFAGGMDLNLLADMKASAGDNPAQGLFDGTMKMHGLLRKIERAGMDPKTNKGGKPIAAALPGTAAAIFDERPVTPLSPGMEPEEIFARYPPILESPLYFSQPVAGEVDTYLVIRSTVENDPLHSERTLTQYRCEQQAFR